MKRNSLITYDAVSKKIYQIRGMNVIFDRDLAEMYGVSTRILNQAVNRNKKRFPKDFMFQLTKKELDNWKSQFVTSNKEKMGLRKRPYAFTEQGIAMLSSVLNSKIAIDVNIRIIRIFTHMRELLNNNKEILLKLKILEGQITNQDNCLDRHEDEIKIIFKTLKRLLNPPVKGRNQIGFRQ